MATRYLASIFIVSCFVTPSSGICNDLDSQGCVRMHEQNPALCEDPVLFSNFCPKFCNKCPLDCYNCDGFVQNMSDCTNVRTCKAGEKCLRMKSVSTLDGHPEYRMTCATVDMCDGRAPLIFGRSTHEANEVSRRNLVVSCCSNDMCNHPTTTTSTTTTTATTTATTPTTKMTTTKPTTTTTTRKPSTFSPGHCVLATDCHGTSCASNRWHCIDAICRCAFSG